VQSHQQGQAPSRIPSLFVRRQRWRQNKVASWRHLQQHFADVGIGFKNAMRVRSLC
ncbi:hypothetical protein AZZ85_005074, partial [Klebsiella pneumoniae]